VNPISLILVESLLTEMDRVKAGVGPTGLGLIDSQPRQFRLQFNMGVGRLAP